MEFDHMCAGWKTVIPMLWTGGSFKISFRFSDRGFVWIGACCFMWYRCSLCYVVTVRKKLIYDPERFGVYGCDVKKLRIMLYPLSACHSTKL